MSEWSHDYWTDLAEVESVGVPTEPPVVRRVPRLGSGWLRVKRVKYYRERDARLARKWVGLE